MNLGRILLLGTLTVSLVGRWSTHQPPPAKVPDPIYQDRPLSEWLRDLDRPESPQTEAAASDAVRHIGVAALPLIIDYLSPARIDRFKAEMDKWQAARDQEADMPSRPPSQRAEALAALDAIAPLAADALPALEKLLAGYPPDPRALYVVARMGPGGVPLLTKCLDNTNKLVRMGAQVCLDLEAAHSEVLYPPIPVGPDAPSFERRNCKFNMEILSAAVEVYRAEHRDEALSPDPLDRPPPVSPPRLSAGKGATVPIHPLILCHNPLGGCLTGRALK